MKKSVSENSRRSKILFAAGAALAAAALYQLAGIGMEAEQKKSLYDQMKQTAIIEGSAGEEDENEASFDYREVCIDFDALKEINEDIVGWILFDENGISYPVVQGEDNEEYLYTMTDQTKNPAGSIFVDASCSDDFSDAHTIIYGHNMKDLSMFGKLKKYGTQKDYYQKNRYFTIYTPDTVCRYEIFAWYEAAEDDSVYQVNFTEQEAFEAFVRQMIKRRYQNTGVLADGTDKIVTLSTCSSAGKRFVVHAKQLDPD